MEYQKLINLLDSTTNDPSKLRTKNGVAINDDSRGTYNTNNQIKFKTTNSKSSLCDYSDAYILASEVITVPGRGADQATKQEDERNKGLLFKSCTLFTDCINKINNAQIDNPKDLDVDMSMCNLVEYSNNYSKTFGNFWQNYKDEVNDTFADSE